MSDATAPPGAATEAPVLVDPGDRAAGPVRHTLPIHLTSLVGRRAELAAASALLLERRLVTLTGVGGSGKTRLAARLAVDQAERWPDGVWWVELEGVTDPAQVAEITGADHQPGAARRGRGDGVAAALAQRGRRPRPVPGARQPRPAGSPCWSGVPGVPSPASRRSRRRSSGATRCWPSPTVPAGVGRRRSPDPRRGGCRLSSEPRRAPPADHGLGQPHPNRARRCSAGGRWAQQPGDRQPPLHEPGNGQDAPVTRLRQARGRQPDGACHARHPPSGQGRRFSSGRLAATGPTSAGREHTRWTIRLTGRESRPTWVIRP
jgi:hypothetical protein